MFNTLYMISSSIAENENVEESVNMIVLLSDVLRYSLNVEKYIATVMEEISVLKSYIAILMLRHGNSFSVDWNITEEIYSQNTLKSLLQPLVENSVEHGIQLLYGKRHGRIIIDIDVRNGLLFLNVTDNGVGMSKEKLDELNKILNTDSIFRGKNVGLKNVVSRIKLLFGNRAGFEIKSDSQSTSVTLYHPIISD